MNNVSGRPRAMPKQAEDGMRATLERIVPLPFGREVPPAILEP
jgi:hypothetical protein